MNYSKSLWLAGALGFVFLAGLTDFQAAERDRSRDRSRGAVGRTNSPATAPGSPAGPRQTGPPPALPGPPSTRRPEPSTPAINPPSATPPTIKAPATHPETKVPATPTQLTTPLPPATLAVKRTPNGHVITTPSGRVREKMEKKPDGEHIQSFTQTGRVQREEVQKADGTR